MKITLTMDEEIAKILMRATEYYGRIFCGQYDVMPNEMASVRMAHIKESEGKDAWEQISSSEEIEKSRIVEEALFQAFHIEYPELGRNAHWGLGYSRQTDIAYNIYQAVRYALAWHRQPEGGIEVSFNTPSAYDKPIPGVTVNGKVYLEANVDLGESDA